MLTSISYLVLSAHPHRLSLPALAGVLSFRYGHGDEISLSWKWSQAFSGFNMPFLGGGGLWTWHVESTENRDQPQYDSHRHFFKSGDWVAASVRSEWQVESLTLGCRLLFHVTACESNSECPQPWLIWSLRFLNPVLWYNYAIRTNKMHTFYINVLL